MAEFHSFNATGIPKAQLEAVEARLDCPMSDPQLPGNVYVFASFQKEINDRVFAASESCDPGCRAAPALQVRKSFF